METDGWPQARLDDAIRLLGAGADERAEAKAKVDELIKWYSGLKALEEETPRVADIRRMLEDIEDLARRLRNRIVRTDYAVHFGTLNELLTYDFTLHPKLSDLRRKAGLTYEPLVNFDELSLASMLEALTKYCETGVQLLGQDRGGQTNVFKARYGNAAGNLVCGAVRLFAEFREGEALTATESGPCTEFCRAMLDCVGVPENFDLMRHVKYAVPRIRERWDLSIRMTQIQITQTNIPGYEPSPSSDELFRRMGEIDRELLKGPR